MHALSIQTPIGNMLAKANETDVYSLELADEGEAATSDSPLLLRLRDELDEYFDGKRREFTVPLAPIGTPFQMGVWDALRRIPYGKTVSYAEEARMLGRPTAVRAVANANGRNPLAIVIPCHRVIASDGGIGGYSAGLHRKEFLLELEGCQKCS